MDRINSIISEKIRLGRNEKGVKYSWLAETIGISPSNLSHKLAKNGFYARELLVIAKVLEIDLNELTREVGDECISND